MSPSPSIRSKPWRAAPRSRPTRSRRRSGTTWSGTLSNVGTLSELKADRSGTLTDELAGHLRLLFPALPQGGVREGMQWTDSTQYPLVSDAFTGTESSVTVYRAAEKMEYRRSRCDSAGDHQQVQPVRQAGAGRPGAGDDRRRHPHRRPPPQRRRRPGVGPGQRHRRDDDLGARRSARRYPSPARAPTPSRRSRPAGSRLGRLLGLALVPLGLFFLWLFAVWPPPVWYRTHWPARTEFM